MCDTVFDERPRIITRLVAESGCNMVGGFDTCGTFGCPDTILPDVPPDSPRTLVAIGLEPASITVPVGTVSTVVARGFYSDGTSSEAIEPVGPLPAAL